MSAPARTIALATATALVTGPGRFMGVTARETAAAAATVSLYDNTSGSGTLVATIALAASSSQSPFFPEDGVYFVNGLYCVITGTVVGSVFIG